MRSRRALNWYGSKNWHEPVKRCVAPFLDTRLLQYLKRNPPRYFVSDNLSWLENAVSLVKEHSPDLRSYLADRLSTEFGYIRGFHGCRPVSLDSYREYGLQPATAESLKREAISCFGSRPRVVEAIRKLEESYVCTNVGMT